MARNPHFKRLKRTLSYLLIRAVIGMFRLLPRRAALGIAGVLGTLVPVFATRDRRRAEEHLARAFGDSKTDAEISMLVRDMFRIMALNFVDTVRVSVMRREDINAVCVPHHLERLTKALAAGNGAIGLTSHAGCWEMLGAYLAMNDIPLSVIARRLYDSRLETLLLDNRASAGIENISRGRDTREVLRALKRGRLLGVLIDQDTEVKGVFTEFFGIPAHTAVAPAALSIKYDAPIVPVLTWRDTDHRHHICIGEPVTVTPTGDQDIDIARLTAACSAVLESFIREHPEQWVWFHRRWKTMPGPDDPVYVAEQEGISV